MDEYTLKPIGFFSGLERYPYDLPHQPNNDNIPNCGCITLNPKHNYEQALDDLNGFSHLWILFIFHKNRAWKPKVLPPRGLRKIGVFATRAPYRPNPIGISCVQLEKIEGLHLFISGHDLLDGTPILDIKPYIRYADAVPETREGWIDELPRPYTLLFSDTFESRFYYMISCGGPRVLRQFLIEQLRDNPLRDTRKRVQKNSNGTYTLAYRTWRVDFAINESTHHIEILTLYSGYTHDELNLSEDRYLDKEIHRLFIAHTQGSII